VEKKPASERLRPDLLEKFKELSVAIPNTDLDEHEVIGLLFGPRCERESRGREGLVCGVIKAKREARKHIKIGMDMSFFDHFWPVVFQGYLRSMAQKPD
jgi:hypothetical protein